MGKEIDVKECLQMIEDLVAVEDKLVTYRTLSKVLKVHTDQAKELLNSYVSKAREKSKVDDLAVVYLIGGSVKSGTAAATQFTLVPSEKLESEKQRFSHVDAEHVYSVCRGRQVTIADIYNAAKSVTELQKEFSSIKCNEEDVQRRPRERATLPPPAPTIAKPFKEEKPNVNSKKEVEPPSKPAKKSPEKKRTSPKKKDATPVPKGGSINAMFKRQAEKKKDEEKSAPKQMLETPALQVDTPKPETSIKVKNKTKTVKQKKKSASKTPSKKLRRIRVMSDSESGSETDHEEKEDALRRMDVDESEPATSSEKPVKVDSDDEIVPATPVDDSKKGRKRIRKQVNTSYKDEEGYLCVKKEYVFESCSDDDKDETPAKSPKTEETAKPKDQLKPPVEKPASKPTEKTGTVETKPKKGKKNASPPEKAKQASIMNFFKKV